MVNKKNHSEQKMNLEDRIVLFVSQSEGLGVRKVIALPGCLFESGLAVFQLCPGRRKEMSPAWVFVSREVVS